MAKIMSAVTTVGTTTDSAGGTLYVAQRKQFQALGFFWVFYCDGTNIVYSTSPDGVNWSVGGSSPVRACLHAWMFGVWWDGTHLHYAFSDGSAANNPILYRMGTPNSDGSITWAAAEQTVLAGGGASVYYYNVVIRTDSSGFPWIGYADYNNSTFQWFAAVIASSTNNGTWTTAGGFPFTIGTPATNGTEADAILVPLTNQKMYAVFSQSGQSYASPGHPLQGMLYNAGWGTTETISTSNMNAGAPLSLSVVAQSDDVHLVFLKDVTNDIIYVKRTFSSSTWSSEVIVQANTTSDGGPTLTKYTASNVLVCFWLKSPTLNHVYYKRNINGVWEPNFTDWKNESNETLFGGNFLSCEYQDTKGVVGVVWTGKTVSPYDIRFSKLTLTQTMVPAGDGLTSFVYQIVTSS